MVRLGGESKRLYALHLYDVRLPTTEDWLQMMAHQRGVFWGGELLFLRVRIKFKSSTIYLGC